MRDDRQRLLEIRNRETAGAFDDLVGQVARNNVRLSIRGRAQRVRPTAARQKLELDARLRFDEGGGLGNDADIVSALGQYLERKPGRVAGRSRFRMLDQPALFVHAQFDLSRLDDTGAGGGRCKIRSGRLRRWSCNSVHGLIAARLRICRAPFAGLSSATPALWRAMRDTVRDRVVKTLHAPTVAS